MGHPVQGGGRARAVKHIRSVTYGEKEKGPVGFGNLEVSVDFIFYFFNTFIYLFSYIFYFLLHCVFVAVRRLSLVAASGGYPSLRCVGWFLLLRSTGSRHAGFSSCSTGAQ